VAKSRENAILLEKKHEKPQVTQPSIWCTLIWFLLKNSALNSFQTKGQYHTLNCWILFRFLDLFTSSGNRAKVATNCNKISWHTCKLRNWRNLQFSNVTKWFCFYTKPNPSFFSGHMYLPTIHKMHRKSLFWILAETSHLLASHDESTNIWS
jgi:hypothetical protein